jgi:hypothetical protein
MRQDGNYHIKYENIPNWIIAYSKDGTWYYNGNELDSELVREVDENRILNPDERINKYYPCCGEPISKKHKLWCSLKH